ncbi:UNVERIFIED_CONTAM: hypothetical protein Sradi_4414100 [Sesamum radiatum]|uniref:Uncharacterized protein n=1 Tax=Sesamum radiatum TaxID=300843 RepID=A0AAW2NRC4_SESRA
MKKYADQNRRFIEFSAGDLVMVKVPDPAIIEVIEGERSSVDTEVCRSFADHKAYRDGSLQN